MALRPSQRLIGFEKKSGLDVQGYPMYLISQQNIESSSTHGGKTRSAGLGPSGVVDCVIEGTWGAEKTQMGQKPTVRPAAHAL